MKITWLFLVLGGYLILLITTSPSLKNISQLGNHWMQFFWKHQSWEIIFSDYLKTLNTPIRLKKPKLKNQIFTLFENPKHTDGFIKECINEIGCFIGGYLKKIDILSGGFLSEQNLWFLENMIINPENRHDSQGCVPIFDNRPKLVWFRSLSFQEGDPTSSWGVLTLQVQTPNLNLQLIEKSVNSWCVWASFHPLSPLSVHA